MKQKEYKQYARVIMKCDKKLGDMDLSNGSFYRLPLVHAQSLKKQGFCYITLIEEPMRNIDEILSAPVEKISEEDTPAGTKKIFRSKGSKAKEDAMLR